MRRVLISRAIGAQKLWHGERDIPMGRAHYSWNIVASAYQRGLASAGFQVQEVVRPEIYQAQEAAHQLFLTPDEVHLAVKPIEELRPMRFVRNFFVCGWEFPEFSDRAFSSNPFLNQLRVLRAADTVLCWTDFTAQNLRRCGLQQVATLPPPVERAPATQVPAAVCLALDTRCAPGSEPVLTLTDFLHDQRDGVRFVSVLNPWDYRKEFGRMVREFAAAAEKDERLSLVVKLVVDNVGTTVGNVNEILRTHYDLDCRCDRVVFTAETMSAGELAALYERSHFYLSAASAEGMNLPVIESMLRGVVPVCTWNSAMSTYLDDSCSLEVECGAPVRLEGKGHALQDFLHVTASPPRLGGVERAVKQAAALSAASRAKLGRAAVERAENRFGLDTFKKRSAALFEQTR